jgi:hypothetical protein
LGLVALLDRLEEATLPGLVGEGCEGTGGAEEEPVTPFTAFTPFTFVRALEPEDVALPRVAPRVGDSAIGEERLLLGEVLAEGDVREALDPATKASSRALLVQMSSRPAMNVTTRITSSGTLRSSSSSRLVLSTSSQRQSENLSFISWYSASRPVTRSVSALASRWSVA